MTTTIDFDALQVSEGPVVTLLANQNVGGGLVGGDFANFSSFASLSVDVKVQRMSSTSPPPLLTVLVEHSDDGLSWSTAETFTFTDDGERTASLASPKAHVRASASGSGAEWYVKSVEVAPISGGAGGSVPYLRLALRHSADFANIVGGVPVSSLDPTIEGALTLPPSLLGNDATIDALVYNPTASDVEVTCTLVVQSGDGTVWIQQDDPGEIIVAGGNANIDFAQNGGSAGVGLSWNTGTKQVDIANAGVYSAFFTIQGNPA